jgi:uncharacterized protein with NAD-binding domain and iron-sulfur cluster
MRLSKLFPPAIASALPALDVISQFQPRAITAVHLWLDRPLSPPPLGVLVGRTGQWVFTSAPEIFHEERVGCYCQVVISASDDLIGRPSEDLAREVCEELRTVWPGARQAEPVHWRVFTHPAAIFSPRPGLDRLRPAQQTPIPNLILAGDWTATGWPATMEGAVRSGYLAIEAILRSLGRPQQVLAPDLPPAWLARKMIGGG